MTNLRTSRPSLVAAAFALVAALLVGLNTPPAQAAWPGSNGRIAFARGGAIVSRSLSSGTVKTLVSTLAGRPTFSPNGNKIAFTRYSEGPFSWDVWIMNADGTGKRNVTKRESQYFSVSFTPSGQRLLISEYNGNVTGARRMFTINLDGTGKRQFAKDVPGSMEGGVYSPNGNRVAYVGGPADKPQVLRTINAAGDPSSVRNMAPTLTSAADPDWSPDSKRIVFSRQSDEPYKNTVHRINADKTGLKKLADFGADTNATYPAWSPSGTRILFTRSGTSGGEAIWRMNPDGTNKTKVDSDGFDPTWQPN